MKLPPDLIIPFKINRMRTKLVCLNANYVSVLARKTRLSRSTVNKFFNGQKLRHGNEEMIYDAALDLIKIGEKKKLKREKLSAQLGVC